MKCKQLNTLSPAHTLKVSGDRLIDCPIIGEIYFLKREKTVFVCKSGGFRCCLYKKTTENGSGIFVVNTHAQRAETAFQQSK